MDSAYLLAGSLAFFVALQLLFLLFIFSRLLFIRLRPAQQEQDSPAVSVIICAWNELENLRELLPLLEVQDYPEYEVIVIDDRSVDGSQEFLLEYCTDSKRIRTVRIEEVYAHITPKKYAVTIGQKHARYGLSLMTDADCRPAGQGWIASMVAQLTESRQVVLGFSPYLRKKGLLNWLIRCETFYTAVQYFSFAAAGLAYMGVGRNLLYRKALFFANRGFYGHGKVLGGDDDLFINRVARSGNVAVNLDPESFMYSIPKSAWPSWFAQKRRHLGVGKLYRTRNKWLLGMLTGSHVFVWLLFIMNLLWGWRTHDLLLIEVTGLLFLVRLVLQWIILAMINRRLDKTVNSLLIPLLDITMFLYYLIMGVYHLLKGRKVSQWR